MIQITSPIFELSTPDDTEEFEALNFEYYHLHFRETVVLLAIYQKGFKELRQNSDKLALKSLMDKGNTFLNNLEKSKINHFLALNQIQRGFEYCCGHLLQSKGMYYYNKRISNKENQAEIHSNISHSSQSIVVLIGSFPVGIDIEPKMNKSENFILSNFSATEIQDIERIMIVHGISDKRAWRDSYLWTLKEASFKALHLEKIGEISNLHLSTHNSDILCTLPDYQQLCAVFSTFLGKEIISCAIITN